MLSLFDTEDLGFFFAQVKGLLPKKVYGEGVEGVMGSVFKVVSYSVLSFPMWIWSIILSMCAICF